MENEKSTNSSSKFSITLSFIPFIFNCDFNFNLPYFFESVKIYAFVKDTCVKVYM